MVFRGKKTLARAFYIVKSLNDVQGKVLRLVSIRPISLNYQDKEEGRSTALRNAGPFENEDFLLQALDALPHASRDLTAHIEYF